MQAASPQPRPIPGTSTPAQQHSPIVLSEAWKQLHLASPSQQSTTPLRSAASTASPTNPDDDPDSSDDGFLSDHSEELHPETGFDPFLAATRRARQESLSTPLQPADSQASVSSLSLSSPSSSNEQIVPSSSSAHDAAQDEIHRWSRIAKYWSKVVDDAIFHHKQPKQGTIDLTSKNITHILPIIADLSRFVALPPPRYDRDDNDENARTPIPDPHSLLQSKTGGLVRHESYLAPFSAHINNDAATTTATTSNRTLARSQSAFQPSLARNHSFARTTSAMSALSSRSAGSYRDHRDRQATLSIFLGSNALTRLPSALFQLQNLRVLSLRSNKLKFLPPAIGDLHNLSELHVANNELQHFPAEILRLKLDVFTWFPNPYLVKPPNTGVLTVRPLLCHRAQRVRQHHSYGHATAELDDVQEDDAASSTTPVRDAHASSAAPSLYLPISNQPPPLIRDPATASGRYNRHLDRTRSDMQVEGFLARGIDQLRVGEFDSISEHDNDASIDEADSTIDADDTAQHADSIAAQPQDQAELDRQRILEAAFADDDGIPTDDFDLTPSTDRDHAHRGKVPGRSRVLGPKDVGGLPTLLELCIRRLLDPYDTTHADAPVSASPFLSPIVHTSDGPKRRRSSGVSSRSASRTGTPLFQPQQRDRTASFGSNASRTRSFSSNGGPEDTKFGKRIPTLLEAYENGTLQSMMGELGHGLVPMLEAARRSATQDWGTRARVRSSSTAAAQRQATARAPSATPDAATTDEVQDVFGGVDAPGSLDRGDDACHNPWYSRCPNPSHCDDHLDRTKPKRDIALHRAKRGFGSTSSVSSLGTTLGGSGKHDSEAADMERVPSTAASSDSGAGASSPLSSSVSSSTGTVGGAPPSASLFGQQVRFSASTSQRGWGSSSFSRTSSLRHADTGLLSGGRGSTFGPSRGMARPSSTQFVRGFSSSSVLSASGLMRNASFAPAVEADEAQRDWPLTEHEHRRAPVFSTPGETRIEWISHIGGIRVAKLGEAQVDLDGEATESATADAGHPSMLGAMGAFDDKDLLPILWRGCSRGCLDFLV
ncbi:uncharacterized protein PSANT_04668 [Moesziomyces antarcticus]|uniref:Uncharacterized protein n=1 Tax=Pseudozyma antarctica TaxID=84753 RepID=A0A5C3FRP0_PSEA2|nr:uncharacterized protein PSANT_04668 [Moesziomyces antarcticus]